MKRKLKTAVCLGLSALAMMSCKSGVSAADTDTIMSSRTITVDPSQVSDDFLVLSGTSSNEQNIKDAAAAIAQGAAEFKEKIDISKYNISKDDSGTLLSYLIYEYPELINLKNSYSYSYSGTTGIISEFVPKYNFAKAEKDKYFTPFNAELDKIVALAKKQSNDFSKALFVHDYIIANCEYATEVYDSNATVSPFVFNAYGCLVNKRAVCQGYSTAYKAVMRKLSVAVDYASSEEMNHLWNTVTINGKTYHADLTWDDPTPDMQGYVGHSNFLCTDAEIKATDHTSWTTSSTISKTSYPNRFWNDINSKMCINGDEVIYAAYNSSQRSYLERRSLTTNKASVIKSTLSGTNWKYVGNFSRLELIDDVLYYSMPNGVNAIALDGSDDQSVYNLPQTETGRLYGFVQKNGKFYGEISTAPNSDGKVVELSLSEFKRSVIPGDVNGDGKVNVLDAIMAQKYSLSLLSLDDKALKAADVSGDGKVSIQDALLIQKMVLNMTI
ncbi:MAG: dockerin type I domain-containing protein [Acutalibacteraceae bacterium]